MIDFGRIPGLWRRLDVRVRDLSFGLLLAGLSYVPVIDGHGTQVGELPARPFDALTVGVIALETLPLAVRRRMPALCLALVFLGFAVDQLRGYHTVASTALAVALMSAGAYVERHRSAVIVLVSLAYVPMAVGLHLAGSPEGVAGLATFYLVLWIPWGVGTWLRLYRASEADRRRLVAETTRSAERTRIARELHDVVTHHVTAMVVQAESAKYLTAAPDRLEQTLTAVTDTGRQAITDLRHLLNVLNPDHGGLSALVEQTRRAGQPVEFTEEGGPRQVTGDAEHLAYRVVQEALTNALKYAHGARTAVHVRHDPKAITVEVGNDGSGASTVSVGGSGRGLAGLGERVTALGGQFRAGPRDDGFVVRARIPV
ncbi:two-component sensor histidine kinase [Virgisporangium aliadipatigenens]|uniref:histidine kinase n=1 Tax=Virgisporangium aliadipatigenens TaxID=741659 RepID=A0A8J3YZ05_9ACTN|nr:histidine kinase [Virgisporangium aliadipatigenens]GIJ52350.1 two-component sensor histidine kinase [Virgisporangium aliadipatigenens]